MTIGKSGRARASVGHVAEVLDVKQEVEGNLMPLEYLQASKDGLADQKIIVGLVLDHVPDADELRKLRAELRNCSLAVVSRPGRPSRPRPR